MTSNGTKAIKATRESKYVEFKESFDPGLDRDWCEIIKDIVALANSGGGVIVVGADSKGRPTESDVSPLLDVDPADIANKIYRYTEVHFSDVDIQSMERNSFQVAAIFVGPAEFPMIFCKPGTYAISEKQQKTAFAQGSVYFRHGAKSEPGNSEDLRQFVDMKLRKIRGQWMRGLRKVVTAPAGSSVAIIPSGVRITDEPSATPIRLVSDPSAPAYRQEDPNSTHPLRQMDVIGQVRAHLPGNERFVAHDALAIRRVYKIDENPAFYYRPRFGSPQYSQRFVDWLLQQLRQNSQFINEARSMFSSRKEGSE